MDAAKKTPAVRKLDVKKLATLAMITCLAYVVMLVSKLMPSVNDFLDFDFKDVVICIGGFVYGPAAAAAVSLVVAFIEMITISTTGPWGFLILLAIQFLQIVVAFIPGEVVQVAAGMIYGPWVGALIIWLGCIISSSFIFVLVHKLGAPFVQAMVPEKYMGKFRDWETSDKFNVIVFILFLIPGLPKDVFTYITPLTHMSMKNFVLISNFARIPGIVLSTYAAAGLVSGNIVESVIIFAVTAAVAIVALVVYGRVTKKSNGSEK